MKFTSDHKRMAAEGDPNRRDFMKQVGKGVVIPAIMPKLPFSLQGPTGTPIVFSIKDIPKHTREFLNAILLFRNVEKKMGQSLTSGVLWQNVQAAKEEKSQWRPLQFLNEQMEAGTSEQELFETLVKANLIPTEEVYHYLGANAPGDLLAETFRRWKVANEDSTQVPPLLFDLLKQYAPNYYNVVQERILNPALGRARDKHFGEQIQKSIDQAGEDYDTGIRDQVLEHRLGPGYDQLHGPFDWEQGDESKWANLLTAHYHKVLNRTQ